MTTAGVNGIAVKTAAVTTISYNEVTGAKSANIRVESATDAVTIEKNTLTSAAKQGISINGGNFKITGNTVKKSGTYGIYTEGSKASGSISKNTVDKTTSGNGIRVCDGKISLTGNTVKNTKSQGIYVVKGTITLKDNTVSATGDKGFKAAGGKVYFVSGNAKMLLSGNDLIVQGTADSKATTIDIPAKVAVGNVSYNVTSVQKGAFKGNTKLTGVTMGTNVKKIGDSAFESCTKLKTVKISSTKLNSIGKKAFYGCKALTTVTLKTTKLTNSNVGAKAFGKTKASCTFKVPKSKVSAYKKILKNKGANSKIKVVKN